MANHRQQQQHSRRSLRTHAVVFSATTSSPTFSRKDALRQSRQRRQQQQIRWFENEAAFHRVADDTLENLQDAIEQTLEQRFGDDLPGVDDTDISLASGVLTIALPPHGTWVLNKQTPNQVSAHVCSIRIRIYASFISINSLVVVTSLGANNDWKTVSFLFFIFWCVCVCACVGDCLWLYIRQQIWWSSPLSGPKRFEYAEDGGLWFATQNGLSLVPLLAQELSHVLKTEITLDVET